MRILVTGLLDLRLAIQAVNERSSSCRKAFQNDLLLMAVNEALDTRLRMVEIARVQEEASKDEEKKVLEECLQGLIQVALQPLSTQKAQMQVRCMPLKRC